jgi:hypothetical protein
MCYDETQVNIPHSPRKQLAQLSIAGIFVFGISPMHCELEPVIGGCPSVNNQSMLLFKRTTPRTVRQPMCDEVGCLHPRATLVALVYISRVKGR